MKGFTHVLEGIIASFLIIGAITTVVPEINFEGSSDAPGNQIRTRLDVLDRSGNLSSDMTTDEIKKKISKQTTSGYNADVTKLSQDSENKHFDVNSGSIEKEYNVSGDSFEIQLFVNSSANLNVSYGGKDLLTQSTKTGYFLRKAPDGKSNMTVNGTGKVDATVNGYSFEQGDRPFETTRSVKYVETENHTSQIGVYLWQPDRP